MGITLPRLLGLHFDRMPGRLEFHEVADPLDLLTRLRVPVSGSNDEGEAEVLMRADTPP
jgi:hypothetical protein